MQRTRKLEENRIKPRQQNKGRKIKTLLSSPIHLAHHRYTVAPLSLRYRSTIAPLSLRCRTDIATVSPCYRSAVAPLSFRCRSAAVALLLRCCCTDIALVLLHYCSAAVAPAVATQSHRYRATVAPLLSLLLSLRSLTAIAPLSRRCRTATVAPAVATQSHRYCTAVALAQRGYK